MEFHKENIKEIKDIVNKVGIKDFWISNFNYFKKSRESYFSLYSNNEFDYIIYKTFEFEETIKSNKLLEN